MSLVLLTDHDHKPNLAHLSAPLLSASSSLRFAGINHLWMMRCFYSRGAAAWIGWDEVKAEKKESARGITLTSAFFGCEGHTGSLVEHPARTVRINGLLKKHISHWFVSHSRERLLVGRHFPLRRRPCHNCMACVGLRPSPCPWLLSRCMRLVLNDSIRMATSRYCGASRRSQRYASKASGMRSRDSNVLPKR